MPNEHTAAPLIALANQKGGVGKSTIAVHLACWLSARGYNVAVIDADPQGATAAWLSKAAPDIKVLVPQEATAIERAVEVLRPAVDAIIADGPPGLVDKTRAILKLADRVILPLQPSTIDIRATVQAVKLLERLGRLKDKQARVAWGVLNCAQAGTSQTKWAKTMLCLLGVTPAESVIGLRMVFREACMNNTVVSKMKGAKQAAQEIETLFIEVMPDGLKGNKVSGGDSERGNQPSPGDGAGTGGGDEVAAEPADRAVA